MATRDPKIVDAALQCLSAFHIYGEHASPIEQFLNGLRADPGWTRHEVDQVARTLMGLLEATAHHPARWRDLWFEGPYIRKQWRPIHPQVHVKRSPRFRKRPALQRTPR